MCFCATGSFVASGGLVVAGAVTLTVAQRKDWPLAVLPFIFALQQAIEGLQWLAPHPSASSLYLGYGYLFFAYLLWPVYLPFAIHHVEQIASRRRMLRWFVGGGALLSLILLGFLFVKPIGIQIRPLGIKYMIDVPFYVLGALWYVIVVCGSLFASSHRPLKWFGVATLFSALLAAVIFEQTFTSVWCFFSACLSIFIYFIVAKKQRLS